MNFIRHYIETKKTEGSLVALLSMLPDIFYLLRKIVPIKRFQDFCFNLHNTKESVRRMYKINKKLGRAWQKHREQDLVTHSFSYEIKKKVPDDSIFLLSGGLDSFIQWRLLNQPKAIYFAVGHRAEKKELKNLEKIERQFCQNIIIDNRLKLGDMEMENAYIPYRNLFFIMLASYYSPNVVLAQILEYAPDKNKSFYRKTEKLLREITTGSFQGLKSKKIKVWTPFADYTKTELVKMYCQKFDSQDLVKYTISCYSDSEKNCGKCSACFRRYVAMKNNGIEEEYEITPKSEVQKQGWNIRDFKLYNFKMYLKRWLEMRKYL